MTGGAVLQALREIARDAIGLRRARGAAAVREPASVRRYAVELRVGHATRHVVAVSTEDGTVVAMRVRYAHKADVAYARDEAGELVGLATRGVGR